MEEVVRFRQQRLMKMRQRRHKNLVRATRSRSDLHPTNLASHAHDVLRRGLTGHRVKDWAFYRRTGALWTDLAHTPADRVHLVVTPAVLEGDERAARHIQKCLQEEHAIQAVCDRCCCKGCWAGWGAAGGVSCVASCCSPAVVWCWRARVCVYAINPTKQAVEDTRHKRAQETRAKFRLRVRVHHMMGDGG